MATLNDHGTAHRKPRSQHRAGRGCAGDSGTLGAPVVARRSELAVVAVEYSPAPATELDEVFERCFVTLSSDHLGAITGVQIVEPVAAASGSWRLGLRCLVGSTVAAVLDPILDDPDAGSDPVAVPIPPGELAALAEAYTTLHRSVRTRLALDELEDEEEPPLIERDIEPDWAALPGVLALLGPTGSLQIPAGFAARHGIATEIEVVSDGPDLTVRLPIRGPVRRQFEVAILEPVRSKLRPFDPQPSGALETTFRIGRQLNPAELARLAVVFAVT